MTMKIILKDSITDISSEVMLGNKIRLLPSNTWKKYKLDDLRAFCHTKSRYGIHTVEQHLLLHTIINGRNCIEIGAGAGDMGHHLRVHMTDSKMQDDPVIKAYYIAMNQPTIEYPQEVEKIGALDAVYKYKPQVVIASWITTYNDVETPKFVSSPFGVRENIILDFVETFILVGNIDIHGDKPIMKKPHEEIYEDWMVSRGRNQHKNRIWIWSRKL